MRIPAKLFSAVALVSLLGQSASLWAKAGTEGASFLDIPVGAGPAALGSAYTSLATDAYAPVWNPAGLGMLAGTEVAAQHLSYLESMHYEFLSIVHPFTGSRTHRGLGFSVQYLGSGDIDRTDLDPATRLPLNGGDPNGTFSNYFASYNLSYGQTLTEKLALGATGKMIQAKLDDVSASAYAMDIAALYKVNDKAHLGASMVNLGSKLKFLNEGNDLPLAFKVGGSLRPSAQILVTADGVYNKNETANFHTGAQWRPIEAISLRAGYKTNTLKGLSPLAGLTMGLGLHAWGQEFAYAWAPYGDLGDAQYFSLLLRFGASVEQKRNLIHYQRIKKHRSAHNGAGRQTGIEPEYQQLMELLSADDEAHVARAESHDPQITR